MRVTQRGINILQETERKTGSVRKTRLRDQEWEREREGGRASERK